MSGSAEVSGALRGWTLLGAFGAAIVAVALGATGLGTLDAFTLGVLLAILPVLSIAQARVLETQEIEIERMPAYLSSIAMLVVLGGGSFFVGSRTGGPSAVGLVPLAAGPLAAWTLGLTLAVMAIVVAFRVVGPALGARESRVLRELLPRTRGERLTFLGVSVAAGLGEELAYRGLALLALVPLLGEWGALLLTSAVFGVLHAYQGLIGMARTALMGAVLAWGVLASGSLWPGILAHAVVDVIAGVLLGERLMVPEPESGV